MSQSRIVTRRPLWRVPAATAEGSMSRPARANETVGYGAHREQVGDLWLPAGPGPHRVVVSIHGGYFAQTYRRDLHEPLARALVASGLAVLNIEYRRARTGGSLEATTDDVMAAISWLSRRPADLAPGVAVVGHSAGGYLALWAASHPAVELVVALAAASDLADCVTGRYDGGAVAAWLGATPAGDPELYQRSELRRRLPTGAATYLVHGTLDRTVPLHQSERYVEQACRAGDSAMLVALEGAGHFAVIEPADPAFKTWQALLVDRLRP
jgi:acetyl esterase/lipase